MGKCRSVPGALLAIVGACAEPVRGVGSRCLGQALWFIPRQSEIPRSTKYSCRDDTREWRRQNTCGVPGIKMTDLYTFSPQKMVLFMPVLRSRRMESPEHPDLSEPYGLGQRTPNEWPSSSQRLARGGSDPSAAVLAASAPVERLGKAAPSREQP